MTEAPHSYPGSDGLMIYEQCAQIVRSYGPPCDESMRAGLLVAIEHFKGLYERKLSVGATADKPALGVSGSLPSGEGDPLVTTDSTRAGSVAQAPLNDLIERCAHIAENGCLVPPDGGSPTVEEQELCSHIARVIRGLALPSTNHQSLDQLLDGMTDENRHEELPVSPICTEGK